MLSGFRMADGRLAAAVGGVQDEPAWRLWFAPCGLTGPAPTVLLPAVVGERLVGFGHAVHFFLALDGAAGVVGGIHQFGG